MRFNDDDSFRAAQEGIASTDAYLFGRKTYEIFARYWPNQPDDNPFAKTLNGKPKYVASRTLHDPLKWKNSSVLGSDLAGEVQKLKAQEGGDISVLGSGELVQALAKHNLVDEYWLMICPIVLGEGKRLFREGFSPAGFELSRSETTSTGALLLWYRPIA